MHAKLLQSCLTLCNPMDCSPPGSSVRGILQARILEWVAQPGIELEDVSYISLLHWQAGSQRQYSIILKVPGLLSQGIKVSISGSHLLTE